MVVVRGYAGLGIMQMVARQVVMEICEKRSEVLGEAWWEDRDLGTVCRGFTASAARQPQTWPGWREKGVPQQP